MMQMRREKKHYGVQCGEGVDVGRWLLQIVRVCIFFMTCVEHKCDTTLTREERP